VIEEHTMPEREVLVRAVDVVKHFPVRGKTAWRSQQVVHAVDGVSFDVFAGETLGLVGESGCGKSTLGRCLIRLTDLTSGSVEVAGHDISTLSQSKLRPMRSQMQMVFQDPYGSLNPRKRIESIVSLTMRINKTVPRSQIPSRVRVLLEQVGLRAEHATRFPHEFSGGQRQRIGIARALAPQPRLIVADEPVSALDVSIQAQIVNLLADLQDDLGLTYVFIAHDLSVVRQISDRVAVMYLGKLVEVGPAEDVVQHPLHPYTEALLSSVPVPDVRLRGRTNRIALAGDVPSPVSPPSGCRFHPRCRYATRRCQVEEPLLIAHGPDGRKVACHYPLLDTGSTVAASGQGA
jgi:oligopeptide/dipeptide ABC transporter ATP-binding protein